MYVADTHALLWYILKKTPQRVRKIFKDAENQKNIIYIPTIMLAEIYHAVLKKKIKLDYKEVLKFIEQNSGYRIVAFDYPILKEFEKIKDLELHDQIIVSTARFLDTILITKDKNITKSKTVKTMW